MTKKAVIRVASVFEESDQISTTVLTTFFKSFLKGSRYGRSGVIAESVSCIVGASDKLMSRCWIDDVWDLRRGERVLNFFVSVATRTFPLAVSLTGRWWPRTFVTSCNVVTSNS
jgi:hypothetical protein